MAAEYSGAAVQLAPIQESNPQPPSREVCKLNNWGRARVNGHPSGFPPTLFPSSHSLPRRATKAGKMGVAGFSWVCVVGVKSYPAPMSAEATQRGVGRGGCLGWKWTGKGRHRSASTAQRKWTGKIRGKNTGKILEARFFQKKLNFTKLFILPYVIFPMNFTSIIFLLHLYL